MRAMRLLLFLILITGFHSAAISAQSDLVMPKQIWAGSSGPKSYLVRCSNLSGNYYTSGRFHYFVYTPDGHSSAIENACKAMDSQGGIRCLLRIRRQQANEGEVTESHWGNPEKGRRFHSELGVDQVSACASIHSAAEDSRAPGAPNQALRRPEILRGPFSAHQRLTPGVSLCSVRRSRPDISPATQIS
jgi:hypothetical protein